MSESTMYKELAERIMMGHSELIPRLFEMIADEDDAKLMLAMPATPEDLAEQTGRPLDEVKESLHTMFLKGLVFISARTGQYRMVRHAGQFHDATILWKDATQEFFDLWKEFTKKEWGQVVKTMESVLDKPATRIIPVETALEDKNQILHYENVREIVDNAKRLAVTKCTCRVVDGACGLPVEVCVQLNRAADYSIERGTGREIDKAEAMEIMKTAREAGLVHVTMNSDHTDHFICNCCSDCCIGLKYMVEEGTKAVSPSRFQATIDEEECIGCEECIERCYFGALSMNEEDNESKAVVDGEQCVGCGLCAVVCPSDAIHFDEARPVDFIPVSNT